HYLGCGVVVAVANDHVFLATGDVEVAVLDDPAHVTRRQPAVAHERRLAARVALHDARRAHAQLAHLAGREDRPVVTHDLHLHVGQRAPDGGEALRPLLDLAPRSLAAVLVWPEDGERRGRLVLAIGFYG